MAVRAALAIAVAALALACTDESRVTSTVVAKVPSPPVFTPTAIAPPVRLTEGVSVSGWEPTQSGWVFVLDTADGERPYLVGLDAGALPLIVIDTVTFEEVATIDIGARTPATLLVMP